VGKGLGVRVPYSLPKLVTPGTDSPGTLREDQVEEALKTRTAAELQVETLVWCLRLLKPGPVSVCGLIHAHWGLGFTGTSGSWIRQPRPPHDDYVLLGDDLEPVETLWNQVGHMRAANRSSVELATRRFVASGERHSEEDELVDLMVCAEALFVGDPKDASDLSYKLGLRWAYYLEPDDPIERRRVFEHARTAYTGRSNIVHGNRRHAKVQNKIQAALDDLPETRELVRRSLHRYLAAVDADSHYLPDWTSMVLSADER
jgi:hypothetical protein